MNPEPDSTRLLLARYLRSRRALGDSFIRLSPDARQTLRRLIRSAAPAEPAPAARPPAAPVPPTAAPAGPSARPPRPAASGPVTRSASAPAISQTAPAAPPLDPEKLILHGADKASQIEHLRSTALACTRCPHLAATRTQVVFGVGNIDAALMFAGEAPGADEDAQGEPFVGRAGQLLTKMIDAMGLTRADVYIANVLKCRPNLPAGTPGNRRPTDKEMEICLPYLQAQIGIIRPKVIVCLGATALQGLLKITEPIGKLRGKWQKYGDVPVMPTYHPSFLLRPTATNATKRLVWEDLLAVMEHLGMPITAKQRAYFLSKGGGGR